METTHNISTFAKNIAQEFCLSNITLARSIDELEAIASVFLAITIAHFWKVDNIGWAAFTGYMVIRAHIIDTLIRGGLRFTGTALGALAAYYAIYLVDSNSIILIALYIATVGAIGIYFALTSRIGYAWLFLAITYSMVAIDSLGHPFDEVHYFAITRIIEVLAGTIASITIGLCSHLIKPYLRIKPNKIGIRHINKFPTYYRYVLLHTLQATLALAPLPFLQYFFDINDLSQAAITILAVLTVPLANITNPSIVSLRNFHRFLGCTLGGLLAIICLPLFHLSILLAMFFLCVGIFIGRHVENSGKSFAYVGTQFSLIFLVVMLPDSFSSISYEGGLSRLLGVFIGMVLIQLVKTITFPIKLHIINVDINKRALK